MHDIMMMYMYRIIRIIQVGCVARPITFWAQGDTMTSWWSCHVSFHCTQNWNLSRNFNFQQSLFFYFTTLQKFVKQMFCKLSNTTIYTAVINFTPYCAGSMIFFLQKVQHRYQIDFVPFRTSKSCAQLSYLEQITLHHAHPTKFDCRFVISEMISTCWEIMTSWKNNVIVGICVPYPYGNKVRGSIQ